jgi:hypothetical protein
LPLIIVLWPDKYAGNTIPDWHFFTGPVPQLRAI